MISGLASSFADPADIRAFDRCKAAGGSDQACFAKGDNGLGCWGDSTRAGSGPACALPPEKIVARWGTLKKARNQRVRVTVGSRSAVCFLRDRMPHEAEIENGAVIDLNPDTAAQLGLKPPFLVHCTWEWVS